MIKLPDNYLNSIKNVDSSFFQEYNEQTRIVKLMKNIIDVGN